MHNIQKKKRRQPQQASTLSSLVMGFNCILTCPCAPCPPTWYMVLVSLWNTSGACLRVAPLKYNSTFAPLCKQIVTLSPMSPKGAYNLLSSKIK